MKKTLIICNQFSPLMAVDADLVDKDGNISPTARVTSLCRCGASKKKPFCDGSHLASGFKD